MATTFLRLNHVVGGVLGGEWGSVGTAALLFVLVHRHHRHTVSGLLTFSASLLESLRMWPNSVW